MASEATGIAGAVNYQPTENSGKYQICFVCGKHMDLEAFGNAEWGVYSVWVLPGHGFAVTCSKDCHERRHTKCSEI